MVKGRIALPKMRRDLPVLEVIFFLLSVVYIFFGVKLIIYSVSEEEYTGREIEFVASEDTEFIVSHGAVVEVVAGEFFALSNDLNEMVVGVLSPKPLGWSKDRYYKAGPVAVHGNMYMVEDGRSLNIRMTSSEESLHIVKPVAFITKVLKGMGITIIGCLLYVLVLIMLEPFYQYFPSRYI